MTPKRQRLELVSSRPPEAILNQRFNETLRAWFAMLVCPWSRIRYSEWRYALDRFESEWLRYLIHLKG